MNHSRTRLQKALLLVTALVSIAIGSVATSSTASAGYVTVPDNYWDIPDKYTTLQDYCTIVPEYIAVPGPDINIKGPCARHDMCYYNSRGEGRIARWKCDYNFGTNLLKQCDYYYSWYDWRNAYCKNVATAYQGTVIQRTLWLGS